MFRVLLWKEIREHLMTFRFGAALVTTFVLVVISVWVLGEDYMRRRDRKHRGRGMRRSHSRLHRDPADHRLLHLPAADARFHAPARPRRLARDDETALNAAACG